MSKSFYCPTPDNVIEDFTNNHFHHAASNRHYEVTWRDERLFVKRYQLDDQRQPFNVLEQEVTYVIGSGQHSRGYLYRTPGGEMFEIPIAWYTQEHAWGMAPGYDQPNHDGFTRPITRSCMFCHNAYPDVPAGSDRYGQPQWFPEHQPEGIDCQRCHGPGSEHVRAAGDDDATLGKVRSSIVNPARLTPRLQMDVCMQCHLQPTSKLTSFQRRFGRADYSYRPGEPLEEYLVHFDFESRSVDQEDRFEIDSHAYRLRQSRCFVESEEHLTCVTCHDPHRKVPEAEVAAYYRKRCFSCHEPADCRLDAMASPESDVAPDDCIACHMPKRRTQDVVHVVMTDHRISRFRNASRLDLIAETPSPVAERAFLYMPDRAPPDPDRALHLAMVEAKDGIAEPLERLRRAINGSNTAAVEPYMELGTAELARLRFAEAADTFEQVIRRAPDSALGYANLGAALSGQGDHQGAVAQFRAALKRAPLLPELHYNLAVALARLGRDAEAVEHYNEALRLRPLYAKCRFNLGNLHARNGRLAKAVEQYRKALAIEPSAGQAYLNLGKALRAMGDQDGADQTRRRGNQQD